MEWMSDPKLGVKPPATDLGHFNPSTSPAVSCHATPLQLEGTIHNCPSAPAKDWLQDPLI